MIILDNPLSNRTKTTARPKSRTTTVRTRKANPTRKLAPKKATTTTTTTPEYEQETTTSNVPMFVDPSETSSEAITETAFITPVDTSELTSVSTMSDSFFVSSTESADGIYQSVEITEPNVTENEPSSYEMLDLRNNFQEDSNESVTIDSR